MTIENINIYNMYSAIIGIRKSYKGECQSDSKQNHVSFFDAFCISYNNITLGEKDKKLVEAIIKKNSSSERKFLRQILVSTNIKAPLYWWKQFDQYKVGVVTNSESTMHTLTKKELTQDDFEEPIIDTYLRILNRFIDAYYITKNKKWFYDLNNLLPQGYLQERLVTLNYEVLRAIYHDRKNHKLKQWNIFCEIIKKFPYFELLIGG